LVPPSCCTLAAWSGWSDLGELKLWTTIKADLRFDGSKVTIIGMSTVLEIEQAVDHLPDEDFQAFAGASTGSKAVSTLAGKSLASLPSFQTRRSFLVSPRG